jgi:hypothetical protein
MKRLNNLYTSSNTIRTLKSTIRWEAHVEDMGENRNAYMVFVGKQEGKNH